MTDHKKRALNRRVFLRNTMGIAFSLPLLEGLGQLGNFGKKARANDERPRNVVFVRSGNGVQQAVEFANEPESFWPRTSGTGASSAISRSILAENADRATGELAAFGDKLTFLRGVGLPFGRQNCGHAESIIQCLTGQNHTGGTGSDPLALGESADFVIARQFNLPGRDPLVLMAGPQSSYINEGLSWRSARTRASAERSPANQYMRMMGIENAPPEIQARVASRRNSVNDFVRDEFQGLLSSSKISSYDRTRLEQHRQAIRDTELRVLSCELDPAIQEEVDAIADPRANDVRPEVVKRHMDIIALAFQCGYTHSATLQIGEGNDQTSYEIGGSRLPKFHWISHRIYSDGSEGEAIPDALTLHHKVDRLHMQLYRYLLERMDSYDSAYGGSLLDDSAAVWLNDLSNGYHEGGNLPWIIAGSCGQRLNTGTFQKLQGVKVNGVLNTLLAAVGCTKEDGSPLDNFGDASLASGVIPGLLRS